MFIKFIPMRFYNSNVAAHMAICIAYRKIIDFRPLHAFEAFQLQHHYHAVIEKILLNSIRAAHFGTF